MNWEIIVSILSLVLGGGWGATQYILNRRINKRLLRAEASIKEEEAKAKQFALLKETNDFLQARLQQKEQRFAEQIEATRKANANYTDAMHRIVELEKEKGEMEVAYEKCIAELRVKLEHFKYWFCRRDFIDCGRRDPEQKVKIPYTPLLEESHENA